MIVSRENVLAVVGDDMGAVPENGDPIGDFERFLQCVTDGR